MEFFNSAPILTALAIFTVVYFFIVTEKLHKAAITVLGASLYLVFHVVPEEIAFEHIDLKVIFLLASMMIIVKITEKSGFFEWIAVWSAKKVEANPVKILVVFFFLTAIFSAFLDNVTTVLLLAPISILIAAQLEISPIPFLITQIFASNIGGTATLIGDPPNIMIGSAAELSFMDFIRHLAPIIIVQLAVFSVYFFLMFRNHMSVSNKNKARIMDMDESELIQDHVLLKKCLTVLGLVILGFLCHGFIEVGADAVAALGAVILIIWTKADIEHILEKVEWATIVFFISLFIMVGGLVHTGFVGKVAQMIMHKTQGNIQMTSQIIMWFSGIFSGILDNIPLVATFIPIIKEMAAKAGNEVIMPVWWSLALGACLGGNGTIVGASANVIVFDIAKKNKIPITFISFLKYSIPLTLLSLAIASVYIQIRYF